MMKEGSRNLTYMAGVSGLATIRKSKLLRIKRGMDLLQAVSGFSNYRLHRGCIGRLPEISSTLRRIKVYSFSWRFNPLIRPLHP